LQEQKTLEQNTFFVRKNDLQSDNGGESKLDYTDLILKSAKSVTVICFCLNSCLLPYVSSFTTLFFSKLRWQNSFPTL